MGVSGTVHIGNDWDEILKDQWQKPYYLKLREFLKSEYAHHTVYPKAENIFNALKYTSFEDTRCVIIGQDPYHGPSQAHGLCFSVEKGRAFPPSLVNIFKEYQDDLGFAPPKDGNLTKWAQNGVLLLNTVLTVRRASPLSHRGQGWEILTDEIIKKLDRKKSPVVFLLWGSPAQRKASIITNPIHLKLATAHPSPLSAYRGFFGCRHFSKTNEFLREHNQKEIDWRLD